MRTIGVISDTHGLLREEAIAALRGSDLILHAGDVGPGKIIERLREIAPVYLVRGNTDGDEWARSIPITELVELGGDVTAYMVHDIEHLDIDPRSAGVRVVVFGHSHRPTIEHRDGVMYFNPGAAGHRRFTLPVTVGRLVVDDSGQLTAEIVDLEGGV